MKVVVVTKPTSLEQHGDVIRAQVERGNVNLADLNAIRTAHEEHYRTLERVRHALEREGIPYDQYGRNEIWALTYDAIITVGGDGTLLSASHRIVESLPLIGVRSSAASVGFLCAGGEAEVDDLVRGLAKGTLRYVERARMRALVFDARRNEERFTVPILNDFLYTNSNPCATTRYQLTIGSKREAQKSSGIWISTATGSTAGIGAAGGELQVMNDHRFQYKVRELYRQPGATFTLTHGFFDPDSVRCKVENQSDHAVLALDGQRELIRMSFGDYFEIQRAIPALLAAAI